MVKDYGVLFGRRSAGEVFRPDGICNPVRNIHVSLLNPGTDRAAILSPEPTDSLIRPVNLQGLGIKKDYGVLFGRRSAGEVQPTDNSKRWVTLRSTHPTFPVFYFWEMLKSTPEKQT